MKNLTRMQKGVLAVQAGMLVLFGAMMLWFHTHPGVLFEEGLLKSTQYEDRIVYSGTAHGKPVAITVTWPTNFRAEVDFTIGTDIHDVCTVEYPLEPVRTDHGEVPGIRIVKNGETVFQGAYAGDSPYSWYDEEGQWTPPIGIRPYYGSGPWESYETTAYTAAWFAFGPETSARGEPWLFITAVLLTLLMMAGIVFHRELFRWNHRWARDPEPTEEYLALERVGWVLVTIVEAVIYIAAMVKIA